MVISFIGQTQSLSQAIHLINEGEIKRAKNDLLELSNKNPKDSESKFWLGVALYKSYSDIQMNPKRELKPLIDAGISFEKAYFLDPSIGQEVELKHVKTFQNLAYNAGISNYQNSEQNLAYTLFKMSSECAKWLEQIDASAYYFTGHCANNLGEFQSALPYLEPLAKEDPKNEKYAKELLKTYLGLNQNEKAANLINNVLSNNQSNEHFWYESMSLNMKTENLNEALDAAKQLCLLDSKNSRNRTLLASLYDQTGDESSAIKTYKEVIEANPTNAQAAYNLGVILYNKVVIMNKSNPSKSNTLKAMELLDDSKKYLLKAQKLDPSNMDIPILLKNIRSMR